MSLETQDIVIIVAAVIGILLLLLCIINICYNLCRKKGFNASENAVPDHHHQEFRSAAYHYDLTPQNDLEYSVQYSHEKPTTYAQVLSSGRQD